MKYIISIIIAFVWIIGASTQKSIYELKISNEKKLPSLEVFIDQESIAKAYMTRQVISNKEIEDTEIEEVFQSAIFQEDHKIEDTKNLLERYITNYISHHDNKTYGTVVMNVTYYNYKAKITLGSCICFITFGAAYVLGVPISKSRTDVEVEMKIYNHHNELLCTYYGIGRNDFKSGLYAQQQDERSSNIKALKKALYVINDQLLEEFSALENALLASVVIAE